MTVQDQPGVTLGFTDMQSRKIKTTTMYISCIKVSPEHLGEKVYKNLLYNSNLSNDC